MFDESYFMVWPDDFEDIRDELKKRGLPVEIPAICNCIRSKLTTKEAVDFLEDFYEGHGKN
jgi:hypothetical protein